MGSRKQKANLIVLGWVWGLQKGGSLLWGSLTTVETCAALSESRRAAQHWKLIEVRAYGQRKTLERVRGIHWQALFEPASLHAILCSMSPCALGSTGHSGWGSRLGRTRTNATMEDGVHGQLYRPSTLISSSKRHGRLYARDSSEWVLIKWERGSLAGGVPLEELVEALNSLDLS